MGGRPQRQPRSNGRPGEEAAALVSKQFKKEGLAVYVPPPCQEEAPPFRDTGPRFYVSVTAAAAERFAPDGGVGPALPRELAALLWPHSDDMDGMPRARGLGWALSPPGSDPQTLHNDIWGGPSHPKVCLLNISVYIQSMFSLCSVLKFR